MQRLGQRAPLCLVIIRAASSSSTTTKPTTAPPPPHLCTTETPDMAASFFFCCVFLPPQQTRSIYHSDNCQYAIGLVIMGSYMMSIAAAQMLPPDGSTAAYDFYIMELVSRRMIQTQCNIGCNIMIWCDMMISIMELVSWCGESAPTSLPLYLSTSLPLYLCEWYMGRGISCKATPKCCTLSRLTFS